MIKPSLDWQSIITSCQCLCLSMQSVITLISSLCQQYFCRGYLFFIALFQNYSFQMWCSTLFCCLCYFCIFWHSPVSSFNDLDRIGVRLAMNVITEGLSPHSLIKVSLYNIFYPFYFDIFSRGESISWNLSLKFELFIFNLSNNNSIIGEEQAMSIICEGLSLHSLWSLLTLDNDRLLSGMQGESHTGEKLTKCDQHKIYLKINIDIVININININIIVCCWKYLTFLSGKQNESNTGDKLTKSHHQH